MSDSTPAWDPGRPFDDLPLLPPTAELESREVLKACIEAHRELASVKEAALRLPDPGILVRTLPLLEVQASAEIENVVTTTDELFRELAIQGSSDPALKEAFRHTQALYEGLDALGERPIHTALAERLCTTLRGVETRVRSVPGTTLANAATGQVVYTPPSGEAKLRQLLANWEQFLNADDGLDPLVRMAVAHYQFEAIHPFTDGNGRTGRLINTLYLVQEGLLQPPVVYLSRYILMHRANYYALLSGVTREGAWSEWTLFMLEGLATTARWTRSKIAAIETTMRETEEQISREAPKLPEHDLVKLLFERPYCRISHVSDRFGVVRQTAARWLQELVAMGVLGEERRGREKLFVHSRFMGALMEADR